MRTKLIIGVCAFILAIGISGALAAQWMYSQGNVSHIEYLDRVNSCYYKGWGLDFNLNGGQLNWVHMTVPTIYTSAIGTKTIRLKIYTGSVDAWISDIHIYNGNSKVHEFTGLSYSNGWKSIELTLPSKMYFNRGLGVSVRINAGVEPGSHRFIFASAGAYFY